MMDLKTYMKRFMLWTAVVTAVVVLVVALCFGKVVVGCIAIVCIMEVFAFTISQLCYEFFYKRSRLKKEQEEKKDENRA